MKNAKKEAKAAKKAREDREAENEKKEIPTEEQAKAPSAEKTVVGFECASSDYNAEEMVTDEDVFQPNTSICPLEFQSNEQTGSEVPSSQLTGRWKEISDEVFNGLLDVIGWCEEQWPETGKCRICKETWNATARSRNCGCGSFNL